MEIPAAPNSYEKIWVLIIDSTQYIPSKLEKVVETLYETKDTLKNFKHMKRAFGDTTEVLCRKGYYPYEWMDREEKLSTKVYHKLVDFIVAYTKKNKRYRI